MSVLKLWFFSLVFKFHFLFFHVHLSLSFLFSLCLPKRSQQSPICPSCPGRTLLFTLKCSQGNACRSRSRPALPQVSSLFRSWTCGSSTRTWQRGDTSMSTASPRRGPGNRLAGHVDAPPTRWSTQHSQSSFTVCYSSWIHVFFCLLLKLL